MDEIEVLDAIYAKVVEEQGLTREKNQIALIGLWPFESAVDYYRAKKEGRTEDVKFYEKSFQEWLKEEEE